MARGQLRRRPEKVGRNILVKKSPTLACNKAYVEAPVQQVVVTADIYHHIGKYAAANGFDVLHH
jgi:hypothetical protein